MKHAFPVSVLSVSLIAVATGALAETGNISEVKVAVTEIRARRGVDPTLARVIEEYLAFQLAKLPGYSVIGRDDMLRLLDHEQQKQMSGCTEDSCMAEIGGALGVDKMVAGAMDKVGESILLTLKLINVRNARVERREMERLKIGTEEQALDGITRLYRRMFKKELSQAERQGKSSLGIWGYISAGVAGALLISGGVSLGLGQKDMNNARSLADKSPDQDVYLSKVKKLEDSGRTKRTLGGVLLVVGGALAVTSVLLFVFDDDGEAGKVSAGPVISGGTFGFVLGGAF
ncbi:MAG: hypothetical protein GXP49_08755 [Deltaproteobacteria bacterium]|nr:hypothetical protein [Deltaproteobacteria bacterium]